MILYKELMETAKFIEARTPVKPSLGIVLGSGLGAYSQHVKNAVSIPYEEIPHFAPPTTEGHEGKLVLGTIANIPVALLVGRVHYYEGHPIKQVVFPVRTLCMLGIDTLLLTNAAGGINLSFRESDLMMITDHISFTGGENPLQGTNLKELGSRFLDMTEAYNKECQQVLRSTAKQLDLLLREGVYAWVLGPSYETSAEIRALRTLGADAVGMSIVPEVIAAHHLGVRVTALSCITNLAAGILPQKLSHEEVIVNAAKATDRLTRLLDTAIPLLPHKSLKGKSS